MLPTTGFFKEIQCPYYDKTCGRPYCHFRHRKRNQEQSQEPPQATGSGPAEIPTYKPTPKSELASSKSHIPISYVPDLVIRSERVIRPMRPFNLADRPTYKPTPISILSTKSNTDHEYKPVSISSNNGEEIDIGKYGEELDSLDVTTLSTEFDLIDEILDDTVKDVVDSCVKSEEFKKRRKSDSSKSGESDKESNKDRKHGKEERHRKDKYSRCLDKSGDESGGKVNEKKRDDKKDSKDVKDKSSSRKDKYKDDSKEKKDKVASTKVKKEIKVESSKEKDRSKSRSKDNKKEEIKDNKKDKHGDCKKKDHKEDKEHRKDKDKKNEKQQSSSSKEEKEHKKEKDNKDRRKDDKKVIKEDKKDDKSHRKSDKDKDQKKEHGKEVKDKRKDDKKEHRKEDNKRDKDKKNKDKRDSNKDKKIKESTSSSSSSSKKKPELEIKTTVLMSPTYDSEIDNEFINFDDDDFDLDDNIEEECYKIFNEYKVPTIDKPEEEQEEQQSSDEPYEPYNPYGKKRVAYDNADLVPAKILHKKPKSIPNASFTLANRIKIARQQQAGNEQMNLMLEMKRQGLKRPLSVSTNSMSQTKVQRVMHQAPTGLNGTLQKLPTPKASASIIDDIINGRSTMKPRRIAPVQNVNSIQQAKARLDEMAKVRAANVLKTSAQTTNKGSKRVAHIPETSLCDIPDVLHSEKSKLPVNVRTRYLTLFADECMKLYASKEDGYDRALKEEYKVYERCSTLATYRNSAMLGVNRIRKELQERESSGLGLILSGETPAVNKDSPFHGKAFYENITSFILTDDELVLHGYPREGSTAGKAIISSDRHVSLQHLEENERVCCRCHKLYLIDESGFALHEEECFYHPLRKRTLRGDRIYLCCKSSEDHGCAMSNTHVSEKSPDRELEGYQSTMDSQNEDDPRNHAVYALDCEMCYTTMGLELTRVTIVDTDLKTIYETLVKPLNPIIDYNTRFSGITKDQMDRTSTSILQVQANILHLCNSKTILIGHSLESDMKALKIIHSTIIDTSVMFPHKFGLPHKRALRVLASEFLKKIIQNDVAGHDSAEDALACMELVIWKVKENLKVKRV